MSKLAIISLAGLVLAMMVYGRSLRDEAGSQGGGNLPIDPNNLPNVISGNISPDQVTGSFNNITTINQGSIPTFNQGSVPSWNNMTGINQGSIPSCGQGSMPTFGNITSIDQGSIPSFNNVTSIDQINQIGQIGQVNGQS